jgi:hypothetical protein
MVCYKNEVGNKEKNRKYKNFKMDNQGLGVKNKSKKVKSEKKKNKSTVELNHVVFFFLFKYISTPSIQLFPH